MLQKTILQTQFGTPHAWTEQYFENVKMLAPYGWSLKVFTPNCWTSSDNIEIVRMTVEDFDDLLFRQCGVKAGNYLNDKGVPAKLVSDYYPAYGQIFADYFQGDFWAHTNWDMVYGRLDHFIPDSLLEECDIWSDDVNAINGIFCVYRNNVWVNNLFRRVPNWEACFQEHGLYGFDEILMTKMVREHAISPRDLDDWDISQHHPLDAIRFGYPPYFGHHSYDRLPQHKPTPQIYFESDGALIEYFEDVRMPEGWPLAAKRHYGREIMAFHFSETKQWPASLIRPLLTVNEFV